MGYSASWRPSSDPSGALIATLRGSMRISRPFAQPSCLDAVCTSWIILDRWAASTKNIGQVDLHQFQDQWWWGASGPLMWETHIYIYMYIYIDICMCDGCWLGLGAKCSRLKYVLACFKSTSKRHDSTTNRDSNSWYFSIWASSVHLLWAREICPGKTIFHGLDDLIGVVFQEQTHLDWGPWVIIVQSNFSHLAVQPRHFRGCQAQTLKPEDIAGEAH